MDGLIAQIFTTAFLATFIRSVVPLLLTALGGLFSERSGVVNIALEGLIIFGALSAAVSTHLLTPSLGAAAPWVGWLAGMLVGGLIAWIHAVLSIKYRADQVISGTAINLLATGVPAVVLTALYGVSNESPKVEYALPLWGAGELRFSPPVFFAFLAVAITWYVMYRTPYGLRLRATGEQPGAAASMGVNVRRMRYSAVIMSGVLVRHRRGVPEHREPRLVRAQHQRRRGLHRAGRADLRAVETAGRAGRHAAVRPAAGPEHRAGRHQPPAEHAGAGPAVPDHDPGADLHGPQPRPRRWARPATADTNSG